MAEVDRQDREYDVVVFGATGFTGRLTAAYLARHAPAGLRWALAGRNETKLARVRDELAEIDPELKRLELLAADVTDPASLADVAARTRVVITTVGPYLTYGEPLVAACAEAGTDYVDLTGEPEFVDRMYVAHHATAERTGARIVHACGFDSIPHDLGVYYTVGELARLEGGELTEPVTVRGVVRASGMASGGTFHSAMTAMSRPRQMKQASAERRRLQPRPEGRSSRPVAGKPHRDSLLGFWLLPLPTIDPLGGGAQRRGARVVRPAVPLLPLRRHQDAALRPGRRRRRRRAGRGRAGGAAAQPAARPGQAGGGPERDQARPVVVHRRLRRRVRRPHPAHPRLRGRPRLRGDRGDARRVRAVPRRGRQPGHRRPGHHRPGHGRSACSPACRRRGSASRWWSRARVRSPDRSARRGRADPPQGRLQRRQDQGGRGAGQPQRRRPAVRDQLGAEQRRGDGGEPQEMPYAASQRPPAPAGASRETTA